jgi:hypothetical protein
MNKTIRGPRIFHVLCLVFALFIFVNINAKADDYLIEEMESLMSSLEFDDPAKGELTLRLADLYFDSSIKEGMDKDHSKKDKALDLYRAAFNGAEGVAAVTGALKIKVQFQIARILEKKELHKDAAEQFESIFRNEKTPKSIKREAAFHLASFFEANANFKLAFEFYTHSVKLCSTIDTCNFAHYRLGWLLYKETKLDEAIKELKLSLWDAKGQIREQVLSDYILFLSNKQTDGKNELKELDALSKKINKPELLRLLAEAYYTAGNRLAGNTILTLIDKRAPSAYYQVRLMEENYGFRKWDRVNNYLSKLERKKISDLPTKKDELKEFSTIIKRFIVQLDAEVQNTPDLNKYLKRSIDLYLSFFPNDNMRKKMQQGWLKSETDSNKKMKRLAIWIKEELALPNKDLKEVKKLRQSRLVLAQKSKKSESMSKIIIEESLAIANELDDKVTAREFTYVAAREMYSNKKFDESLPLFTKLAKTAVETGNADKWAVMSQNLLLDIYNSKKDFKSIMSHVSAWQTSDSLKLDKGISKEMTQMAEISSQAKFEWAASQGESIEALNVFYTYCMNGTFSEKSCPNAKVLSVKLKDQKKLVSLLIKAKDEKALMNEYELMGLFSQAAKLQEKFNLNRNADLDVYLKIALLYEIDMDLQNRDRILSKMLAKIKKAKKFDDKYEKHIYLTLSEAGLLNERSLSLPWSLSNKLKLAHRLEVNKSKKKTQKILLSQDKSVGPAWSKLILDKVQRFDTKQRKISFYGRSSAWKFKKRTKALTRLNKEAKKFLDGSDIETRVYLINMLANAYSHFTQQIMETPLPEGLDPETLKQVQGQLVQMSAPFKIIADDYTNLQKAQLAGILDLDIKSKLEGNIKNSAALLPKYSSLINIKQEEYINVASFDYSEFRTIKNKLQENPENVALLESMEAFYQNNKSIRVSSYFNGRIKDLKK